MMSIEETRRVLGEDGQDMTDEQLKKLMDSLYPILESILDKYFNAVDGNHRILAYRCWRRAYEAENLQDEDNKKRFLEKHKNLKDIKAPKDEQWFWIAKSL